MYKIQIGFEDGYYVAYLARHYEGGLEANVEDEIENLELEDLINDIEGLLNGPLSTKQEPCFQIFFS